MITHPKDDLLARIPHNSFRTDLCGLVEAVYACANGVDDGLARIKNDRNLSDEGKKAAKVKYLGSEMAKLSEPIRRYNGMLAQIAGQRKELGKPEFKTDAVSVADRQEVRAILRAEPDALKRKVMALELAETRECAEAILSGYSLAITKLDALSMQEVRERYLEKFFGEERAAINKYHDNVKPLGSAIALARLSLQNSAELHPTEFAALMPKEFDNTPGLEAAA